MDTVNLMLSLLAALFLAVLALSALVARFWYALRLSQSENLRLVAQSRPRSPQKPSSERLGPHAAGYDTGLVEVER